MSFGTLELPAGWVLNEEFSSENRAVFVPADWDGEEKTDYITAEHGENRYAADDLHSFSEAILRQLLQQAQGATVTGYGGVTEQELPALVYEISDGADGTSAAQYYIVEDYGYVLINAANADDGDDGVLEAAEYITDSFTFAE